MNEIVKLENDNGIIVMPTFVYDKVSHIEVLLCL